jgi:hypothetical protein
MEFRCHVVDQVLCQPRDPSTVFRFVYVQETGQFARRCFVGNILALVCYRRLILEAGLSYSPYYCRDCSSATAVVARRHVVSSTHLAVAITYGIVAS